ncbi:GrpB family protein [Bacillus sp. RG28]|uniref:GrpB family protein n=1 Tax=Gottfriedia endophytica TaxID=2820819 RepID=A0A940NPS3_9BACI|nr:GrpB family protein [Gottfriedia endophytica]MBP0725318.1 GrpB family protein [Gottfriedia endophytica]
MKTEGKSNPSGIEIVEYDELWPEIFITLKQVLESTLGDLMIGMEHVGSTSIKGLGAKPILDIDVIIEDYSFLPAVIEGLSRIGYYHQENWSFIGREAFGRKDTSVPWDGRNINWMEHHLYVCHKDSEELVRHLAFRDYLRKNPQSVVEYEQLKKSLSQTANARASYTLGKTDFINTVLAKIDESPCE